MQFKVGDKVKYDGGDLLFFGTISAVFEHSICPFYRLDIERMEKEISNFSITQFEFELESANEDDNSKDERNWRNVEHEFPKKSPEVPENIEKVKLPQAKKKKTTGRKISEAWDNNFELFRKGIRNNAINIWASSNRKKYKDGKLLKEKYEKLMEISFPFDVNKEISKKKRPIAKPKKAVSAQKPKKEKPKTEEDEIWEQNFEAFSKGKKGNAISSWMGENRKLYRDGKLSAAKYEKLLKIDFPFDPLNKKLDSWDKQLEEWKKGNRKSIPIQQWRQRSIRHFVEGKLSGDRIVKLKEVGILK